MPIPTNSSRRPMTSRISLSIRDFGFFPNYYLTVICEYFCSIVWNPVIHCRLDGILIIIFVFSGCFFCLAGFIV